VLFIYGFWLLRKYIPIKLKLPYLWKNWAKS
jgi:hypothetical protein